MGLLNNILQTSAFTCNELLKFLTLLKRNCLIFLCNPHLTQNDWSISSTDSERNHKDLEDCVHRCTSEWPRERQSQTMTLRANVHMASIFLLIAKKPWALSEEPIIRETEKPICDQQISRRLNFGECCALQVVSLTAVWSKSQVPRIIELN